MAQKIKDRVSKYRKHFSKNYRKYFNSIRPYKQSRVSRKSVKISAYMSIFNDGDFLVTVLEHIKDFVDELVVVDGAFEWMVPYLEQVGIDPLHSKAAIYDAISASGIPYRTVTRIWTNELEKRKSGYEECSHRYVMRVDADEILYFDERCVDEFIGSGCAVAEMQFPLYLMPGWVVGSGSRFKYPAQCLMFDSSRISAAKHLEYLWLVLPADDLPEADSKTYPIYEKPVAFAAHLSVWRSTDTAAHRAAFYVSNWIRKHGVPWVRNRQNAAAITFAQLFEFIPAGKFREAIRRIHVAFGVTGLSPHDVIMPTPLSDEQERDFAFHYQSYIDGLADLNKKARDLAQVFIYGEPIYLDITRESARRAVSTSNVVHIKITSAVDKVTSTLVTIKMQVPFVAREDLPCKIEGDIASFDMSPYAGHEGALRQFIELRVSGAGSETYGYFQIVGDPERIS